MKEPTQRTVKRTRATENTPLKVVLTLLAVLGLAACAGTVKLSSGTLTAAPAQSLQCYLTNVGTKPFTAVPPDTTIRVQVIDRTGANITSTSAGGCAHATLDPGQTCGMFADSGVLQLGHCEFRFKGSKKHARANALLQDNATFGTVTVLPAH